MVNVSLSSVQNLIWSQNFGMTMPGWHDIRSFDKLEDAANDEPGIQRSQEYIQGLIKAEIDGGIPSSRIVVGMLITK